MPRKPVPFSSAQCRKDIEFIFESDSCTVVAMATIMASSYNTAHCLLENAGRQHGRGFALWPWLRKCTDSRGELYLLSGQGIRFKAIFLELTKCPIIGNMGPRYPKQINYELVKHHPTFGRFAQEHKVGWYLIFSRNHVAVVADGKLYDEWPSGNSIVIRYVQLTPI